MLWSKQNKEKERFYLFAGMGGRALRRKKKVFLAWSIAAGLLVSVLVALGLYLVNTRH